MSKQPPIANEPHSAHLRKVLEAAKSRTNTATVVGECHQVVGGLVDFRINVAAGKAAHESISVRSSGPQSRHLHARALQGTVFYPAVKGGGSKFFLGACGGGAGILIDERETTRKKSRPVA